MKNLKLTLKDLVTLGVFMAIYFVLNFAVGTPLGITVIGFLFHPFVFAAISGIVTMFFMAKVQKPWAIFLFVSLLGLLMTLMGHTPIVAIHSLIIGLLAESVRKISGYSSIKGNILTNGVLSLWLVSSFLQIFIMQDAYYQLTANMMGDSYASQLVSLPLWIIPVLYVSAFIGGILGGVLGAKVLRKHFKKAGLV
jgi:energy-coupling factor transport system substrate-specific component